MAVYFIAEAGQRKGPFSIEELRARGIGRGTRVWQEGMSGWTSAGDVPALQSALPPPKPAVCAGTKGMATSCPVTPSGSRSFRLGPPIPPAMALSTGQPTRHRRTTGSNESDHGPWNYILYVLVLAAVVFVISLFNGAGCDEAARDAAWVVGRGRVKSQPPPKWLEWLDSRKPANDRTVDTGKMLEEMARSLGPEMPRGTVFVPGERIQCWHDLTLGGSTIAARTSGTIASVGAVDPIRGQRYRVSWLGLSEAADVYERDLLPADISDPATAARVAYSQSLANAGIASPSPTQSFMWCRRAAELGHAEAMSYLGLRYLYGNGTAVDNERAVSWFQCAVDRDQTLGFTSLGYCYLEGRGVARDYSAAIRLFERAAARNEPCSMSNLGVCFQYGWGVPRNYKEAVNWYRRGAEGGSAPAMCNLGLLYTEGLGVARDETVAVQWLQKAAAKGEERAVQELKRRGIPLN